MQIDTSNSVKPVVAPTPAANENSAVSRLLITAVRALNKSELLGDDRQLQFARDPGTHTPVIRIIHPVTGEVIEQIPAEAVLRAYESLAELNDKESKR
jgi:uncharacterized FlaG/YvyC family protein